MSSAMPPFAAHASRPAPPGPAPPAARPGQPVGIFNSGTKVQVGQSRVVVDRYLSEGGFAHVYVVKLPKPIAGEDKAVLKRVAVADKQALATMRTEIETMKKLRGHRQIVTYFDSHASQLQGGGYEVFVLMEFCTGGGLIDFMNTRLQNRLTEPEILKIFSDTAQGVAAMHYLKPPLVHRDLKIENILIKTSGGQNQYKLCDFGSSAPPRPAATSAAEGRLIEEDIQRHTTMQYRSPEMIDVYRKQPIDEKSDIWALGVFLYKLCYYTTPFEEQGQMAILNASFRFPGHPQFSDRLKRLIAMMLQEKPTKRPNIYQVIREVCSMRGTDIPIKDIYASRTASETRRNQELPPTPGNVASPPTLGASKVVPVQEKQKLPEITPMRRGRPTKETATISSTQKPSPSPRRPVASDPFAALDSNGAAGSSDELSNRFPTLNEFSILHNSGGQFAFDSNKPQTASQEPRVLSQRVTDALADDAFVPRTTQTAQKADAKDAVSLGTRKTAGSQTASDSARPDVPLKKPAMVSTGTMTVPSPQPEDFKSTSPSLRPIYRFPPSDQRSSSQPRAGSGFSRHDSQSSGQDTLGVRPPIQTHRSQSQTNLSATKISPSLLARDSSSDIDPQQETTPLSRIKSRPISGTFETAAKLLHVRSSNRGVSPDMRSAELPKEASRTVPEEAVEESQVNSNVEFLRQKEEESSHHKRWEKRLSSGSSKHGKRTSLPSVSLSGTKNILAGKFGDAFKRFETNTASGNGEEPEEQFPDPHLTPIEGSEATDGRSDDGQVLEESEEVPPEVRRELERRRLSQEEKRVAQAGAEYKQRLAGGGAGKDSGRAAAIQNRVQALLDQSAKPAAPAQTAEGYGRFTASAQVSGASSPAAQAPARQMAASEPPHRTASLPARQASKPVGAVAVAAAAAGAGAGSKAGAAGPAPGPKPKPQALRTGGGAPAVANKPSTLMGTASVRSPASTVATPTPATAIPTLTPAASAGDEAVAGAPGLGDDDWEATFAKKYPSLAGLEMVETEIEAGGGRGEARKAAERWRDI